jgi:arabinogalactan oligomer / maltooligosaccharide transport system substrate-binding protein
LLTNLLAIAIFDLYTFMKSYFKFVWPVYGMMLAVVLLLVGCSAPAPLEATPTEEPLPSPTHETPVLPTQTVGISPTSQLDAYPPPLDDSPYPAPQQIASPTPEVQELDSQTDPYPPPDGSNTDTGSPYPPPGPEEALPTAETAYPEPPLTPPAAPTLAAPPSFLPTPTVPLGTPGPTPTERVVLPAMPPPSPGSQTVTIWHSWNIAQAQVLEEVLAAYQRLFPDTYFDVLYVPHDDLLHTFHSAAYRGAGPSLLLAPAEWGPELYDGGMVASVNDLAIPAFLDRINPAALEGARYRGNLISLPHSIRDGVVMYRNRQIIPRAPATFNDLVSAAKTATRGGRVGAYLERGFYYSAGHLMGIGGRLMDENGNPSFNNQKGTDWLNLLVEFEQAGAVSFNTNRDLDLFKAGRVGIIIDGTWNRDALVNAIGEENLYIDPWPTYKDGHLSGFIQTDNIYLASRAAGNERYAALQFIGFMLAPEVQAVLTRANHIPALKEVEVETEWMKQAMVAFAGGTPYPTHPNSRLYWDAMETSMGYVFNKTALAEPALVQARDSITARIRENQTRP